MIRSSNHNLLHSNIGKLDRISSFVDQYRALIQSIVDFIWSNGYQNLNIAKNKLVFPKFLDSSFLKNFNSPFTERLKQCAGKQALAMISAATKKRSKQLFNLKKFQKDNHKAGKLLKSVKYLQRKVSIRPLVKPNASNINIELDSRFVDFQFEDQQTFLCFIRLSSFQSGESIKIPITKNPVFDKWNTKGELKRSIRITKKKAYLFFDLDNAEKKKEGNVVGCDQGIVDVLMLSDGQKAPLYQDRYSLSDVQKILSRKVKGSRGFRKAQTFRDNLINWSINQINFSNVKELRLEKLHNVGIGKRRPRFLSHWTYRLIKDKLARVSEEKGFLLKEVPNEFRSQRCSECSWVQKANRKGKTFCCIHCGNTMDADLNAATNLSFNLYEIPYWVRSKGINLQGFYWTLEGIYSKSWESIVPDTKKK